MQNKRGQGLSTSAIVLIILGVLILVVLAIGFFAGWRTILPWINKDNNVEQVVRACEIACSTNVVFDYCSKNIELVDGDNKFAETCNGFATKEAYVAYNIAPCGNFNC